MTQCLPGVHHQGEALGPPLLDARLVTVDNAAHVPWIEDPQAVLGAIETFLDRSALVPPPQVDEADNRRCTGTNDFEPPCAVHPVADVILTVVLRDRHRKLVCNSDRLAKASGVQPESLTFARPR